MRTHARSVLLLLVAVSAATFGVSCWMNGEPGLLRPPAKSGISDQVALSESTIVASWDTWWQNISGLDAGIGASCDPLCTDSSATWTVGTFDNCAYTQLARWSHPDSTGCVTGPTGSGVVDRTYPVWDFDTSWLPDGACIQSVELILYFVQGYKATVDEDPPNLTCNADLVNDAAFQIYSFSTQHDTGQIGRFYGPIPSAGYNSTHVEYIVNDMCDAVVYTYRNNTGPATITPDAANSSITIDMPPLANKTGFSRYAIDLETVPVDEYRLYKFASVDHSDTSKRPRLRVTYYIPSNETFGACRDGLVTHSNSDCSSCASNDFTQDSAGTTATIYRDGTNGNCGQAQASFRFATNTLCDNVSIASATLRFFVVATADDQVTTHRLRVYYREQATTCSTTLSWPDFVGCASNVFDLGLVTITASGAYEVSIPTSRVTTGQYSEYIIVDASVFSDPSGSAATAIGMTENTNSTRRPTLAITF